MKKFFIPLLLFLISFSSCKKQIRNDVCENNLVSNVDIISVEKIKSLLNLNIDGFTNINNENFYLKRSSITSQTADFQKVDKLNNLFLSNGILLHAQLLSQIKSSSQYKLLPIEDKSIIEKIDNESAVLLSLLYTIYTTSNYSSLTPNMQSIMMTCLSAALGIDALYGLVKNTRALMTVSGAVNALKLIARRYLGWIAVGIAVYEFIACYKGLTTPLIMPKKIFLTE